MAIFKLYPLLVSFLFLQILAGCLLLEEAFADPFYRETFGYAEGASTSQAAQAAGWKAIRTERAIGKTSVWKINAPGSSNEPLPLNSFPQGANPGHGSWGEAIPNGLIIYTDEVSFDISKLAAVRYEQRLSGLDSVGNSDKTRLALLIGNTWYISDAVRIPAQYSVWGPADFDLPGLTFSTTTHVPCAGPATPSNSGILLPASGTVRAFGVFMTKVHGRVRIDNYELEGVAPLPATFPSGDDSCPDGIGGPNYPIDDPEPTTGACPFSDPAQCELDSDSDSLKDWEEENLGTDPLNPDTDGDGESDGDEVFDGSNPLDRGSYFGTDGVDACLPWNTHLDMWNVAEHSAARGFPMSLTTFVRDLFGGLLGSFTFSLQGFEQQDLLVHDVPRNLGLPQTYGTSCTTFVGPPGSLRAGLLQYRPSSISGRDFQFALAFEASPGSYGAQVLPFNTFSPSLGAGRERQLVANWITIINREHDQGVLGTGTLRYYSAAGALVGEERVSLTAGERRDFAGGHQFGANAVGMADFVPDNAHHRFQLSIARYVFKDAYYVPDDVIAAVQVPGIVGSGQPLLLPLDTSSKTAVLELLNPAAHGTNVSVKIYDLQGALKFSGNFSLLAKATYHLIADQILGGAAGYAVLQGDSVGSLAAISMHYVRDEQLMMRKMWGIVGKEALGSFHVMSFNSFLGQRNMLWGINPGDENETATVEIRTLDGTSEFQSTVLPAHNASITELKPPVNQYGPVVVSARRGKTIWWLLREHPDFVVPVTATH